MTTDTPPKQSQLIASLREGVGIVQMVFYKEVRAKLMANRPELEKEHLVLLAGSITNEVFGTRNPAEKFNRFRLENKGDIEQELLNIKQTLPSLCPILTDALRIQTLCDNQEGSDSTSTLIRARELALLDEERDIPLPSTFMTAVRELGEKHNLIVPPVQITPDQDDAIIH